MQPRRHSVALVVASLLGLSGPVLLGGSAGATNDPHWGRQWAPVKVGAPTAWNTTTGGGVKIGIVDSGVDLAHEDLQGRVVANAACIGTNGDPAACTPGGAQDQIGHGTHVAGIAAATKDNGKGIAGIAPTAQLVVARVFEGDSADLSDVEAGIEWVVGQGARIVNLSLGENLLLGGLLGGQSSLVPVLNQTWARGAIPVVAAGNAQLLGGSGSYGDVNAVVVGATGREDELASYSVPTENAKWALVAPGGNGPRDDPRQVYSTLRGNQYGYLQGTSMAAPHVSGALALLLSRPGVTQQRAVDLLLSTADRRVSCGPNSPTCVGRLDVASAIAATGAAAPAPPPVAAPPAPAPAAVPAAESGGRKAARPAPAPAAGASRPAPAPAIGSAPAPGPAPAAPGTDAAPNAPVEPGLPAAPGAPEAPAPEPAGPLRSAAAATSEDGADVEVPGAVAGGLLVLVAAGAGLLRRRAAAV